MVVVSGHGRGRWSWSLSVVGGCRCRDCDRHATSRGQWTRPPPPRPLPSGADMSWRASGAGIKGMGGDLAGRRTEVQDKMKTKELTNAGLIDKIPSQHRRAPDLQGTMLDVRDVDRRALRPLRWRAFVASGCGSTVGARGVVVAGTGQYWSVPVSTHKGRYRTHSGIQASSIDTESESERK